MNAATSGKLNLANHFWLQVIMQIEPCIIKKLDCSHTSSPYNHI